MTIDLEHNKIAFGLLSEEEQEHLSSWQHGLLVLSSSIVGRPVWCRADPESKLSTTNVYRTVPAPVEPKRETVWVAYDDAYGTFLTKFRDGARRYLRTARSFAFRIEYDAETGDNPTIVKETFDD